MIFRTAKPEDHSGIVELLLQTDIRWNVDILFDKISLPHNTFVCEQEGKLVAMLYLFPASVGGNTGYFMQPLSIAPELLNSAVAKELIEYAKHILQKKGARFIITTAPRQGTAPAGWLADSGFTTCTLLNRCEFNVDNLTMPDVEFFPVEPAMVTSLRASNIKGDYLTFSDEIYKAFCSYWQHKNAVLAVMPNGYGIYIRTAEGIVFRELFTDNILSAAALISVVGKMEGFDNAVVYTAHNTPFFEDNLLTVEQQYGLICPLDDGFKIKDLYMNMMFD